MTRHVALLRAINVGGHTVKMAELAAHFEAMGFSEVRTFIASGNVLFEGGAAKAGALEARIESGLKQALGFEVLTFLRRPAELAALVASPPFSEAERAAAGVLNVAFHKAPLGEAAQAALAAYETGIDLFRVRGREVYWLTRTQQSESPFFKVGLEKALKLPSTTRSLSSLTKLLAQHPPA